MRTRRQKIQLELALGPTAKGEARSAGGQGTEAGMARAARECPATGTADSVHTELSGTSSSNVAGPFKRMRAVLAA